MRDSEDVRKKKRELQDLRVVRLSPDNHEVVSSTPQLFSEEELLAALLLKFPEDEAREMARDWCEGGLDAPGLAWSDGLLVLVALNSPHTRERIRAYAGWSEEDLQSRLDAARRQLNRNR